MTQSTKDQFLASSGLLLVTFFWGAAFIPVKITITEMNLYYFLFLRFIVAAIIMFVIFYKKVAAVDRGTIKSSLILSIFLSAAYITQTEGLRFTSAANSALITCLYMVMIPVICLVFEKTKLELFPVIGILLAFFGMYLLTAYSLTGLNLGDIITLACAVACAFHIILTGRYSRRHKLVPLVAYQLLFAGIICGAVALFQHGITTTFSRFGIMTVLFTAIFATVLAFLVQSKAQRILSSTRAGVICSMEAVFGALIPWAIGFETPTKLAIIGASIMVAGMFLSEIKTYRTTG